MMMEGPNGRGLRGLGPNDQRFVLEQREGQIPATPIKIYLTIDSNI
jgi:hypothetical protein